MNQTFYKRNKNNKKIQEWSIELHEDGKYRTHEGYQDGKITTNDWTVSKPKNVGKKSETSAYQQAQKEIAAKIVKKQENAYTSDINEVDNVEMYFEPMLAHKFNKGDQIDGPVLSQPKLDGIRNVCKASGNFTRKGKPQPAVPHIYESLKSIFEEYPDLVIDGELYNHDLRDDFNQITSIARKQKPTAADLENSRKKIQFHVYDVCFLEAPETPLEYRLSFIEDILADFDYVEVVPTNIAETQERLDELYGDYIGDGFEGQMLRTMDSVYDNKRSKSLLKRKTFFDAEFKIVRFEEGKGNWTGKAKKVYCVKEDGTEFKAGIKGNMEYCTELLENQQNYIGKQGTIRFPEYTKDENGNDNVPRFGVFYGVRDYE
jgi:ATP-dependent DNA ligase